MSTPEQRARALAYYYAHREKILEKRREKYRKDEEFRDGAKKRALAWYYKNPNQAKWNREGYYRQNRDKLLAYAKRYYNIHKERYRVLYERRKVNA